MLSRFAASSFTLYNCHDMHWHTTLCLKFSDLFEDSKGKKAHVLYQNLWHVPFFQWSLHLFIVLIQNTFSRGVKYKQNVDGRQWYIYRESCAHVEQLCFRYLGCLYSWIVENVQFVQLRQLSSWIAETPYGIAKTLYGLAKTLYGLAKTLYGSE